MLAAHGGPGSALLLALQLNRGIDIIVEQAFDGERLESRKVYVIPPAKHGLVVGRTLRLSPLMRDSDLELPSTRSS